MVFGIKNKFKALDFLQQIQADSQINLQESEYQGIKITESKSENDTIVYALIGSKLLLSEEIDVIKQAIDTYRGEPSLASASEEMLAQKLDTGDALVRLYVPNYNNLISQAMAENNSGEMPFDFSTLQPIESTAIGLGVEEGGLRLQSVTRFNSKQVETSFSANKGKIINRFPEDTVALVSGQGIDEFWSQAIALLKQDSELSKYFNLAKLSVRQATNIDLEQDLFNWMDGEFALGIVPTSESLIPELDWGLSAGIVLESSQPEKARETIAKLENTLQQNWEISPSQSKIDNKAVTQWQAYNVPGVLNYGWLDENHLLFTADNSTFKSIDKPNESLAKSNKFKAIAQKLPRKNSGYLYIDMAQTVDFWQQLTATETDPEIQQAIAWFDSIQSIGSTVTMPDESTTQQDLFVLFEDN